MTSGMKLIVVGGIAGRAADAEATDGIFVEAPTPANGAPSPVDGAAAVAARTSTGGAIAGASGVGEVPEGAAIEEVGRSVDGRRCRGKLEAKEGAGGRRRPVR
uniref:Uncharacterized protein n=1 Tax=Setaria viridis TaxID=4556 RepID=A0A4U6U8Q3_SETVI|nr:hypothetical protein SEVIR_6G144980v2 [Setaria viridis]